MAVTVATPVATVRMTPLPSTETTPGRLLEYWKVMPVGNVLLLPFVT